MPLTTNTIPPVASDYLRDGNTKDDLIEWLWGLLSDDEKEEIIKEATEQFVLQDSSDPTMPMGPNGNERID